MSLFMSYLKIVIAKYEDLSDILERSPSSAERYIKQAIDSEFFKEEEWKDGKEKQRKVDMIEK